MMCVHYIHVPLTNFTFLRNTDRPLTLHLHNKHFLQIGLGISSYFDINYNHTE